MNNAPKPKPEVYKLDVEFGEYPTGEKGMIVKIEIVNPNTDEMDPIGAALYAGQLVQEQANEIRMSDVTFTDQADGSSHSLSDELDRADNGPTN